MNLILTNEINKTNNIKDVTYWERIQSIKDMLYGKDTIISRTHLERCISLEEQQKTINEWWSK